MEKIFEVYWEGPFSLSEVENRQSDQTFVLYAVHSTHPLYGKQALVYIGMTMGDVKDRLKQHDWWTSLEADDIVVRLAAIAEFDSWSNWRGWSEIKQAKTYSRDIILAIESLLIYAHQPAYNDRSKLGASNAKDYRLFNTGHMGPLLPEVSGRYYLD